MRGLLLSVAFIPSAIAFSPVAAHPEPREDRGPSTTERAQQAVLKLISQAKLPASWANATVTKFDVRSKNGIDQYVIVFENKAIRQPAKRTLYVIMSTSGDFVSAGHKLI